MENTVVILCAGGPAPGMNTVVASVAKTFLSHGWRVLGLHGGYGPLFKSEEANNFVQVDLKMAEIGRAHV